MFAIIFNKCCIYYYHGCTSISPNYFSCMLLCTLGWWKWYLQQLSAVHIHDQLCTHIIMCKHWFIFLCMNLRTNLLIPKLSLIQKYEISKVSSIRIFFHNITLPFFVGYYLNYSLSSFLYCFPFHISPFRHLFWQLLKNNLNLMEGVLVIYIYNC